MISSIGLSGIIPVQPVKIYGTGFEVLEAGFQVRNDLIWCKAGKMRCGQVKMGAFSCQDNRLAVIPQSHPFANHFFTP